MAPIGIQCLVIAGPRTGQAAGLSMLLLVAFTAGFGRSNRERGKATTAGCSAKRMHPEGAQSFEPPNNCGRAGRGRRPTNSGVGLGGNPGFIIKNFNYGQGMNWTVSRSSSGTTHTGITSGEGK